MATFTARKGKHGVHYRALIRKMGVIDCATFPSLTQAKAWATRREAEILAGQRGFATGHTVGQAIDRFILTECPKRRGGRWDKLRLEKFKRDWPRLALRPLHKLTSDDMARWRDDRLKEVSPGSVAREMNLWGALFSIAVREWRWIGQNPIKGVKRPTEPPNRRRGISLDEVAAIVANLDGPSGIQVRAAFLLALETAMRAGEILGLTWDHVDLQNRVVTLPKTKNGDSRQVPLSNAAKLILSEAMAAQQTASDEEIFSGSHGRPVGPVFTITSSTLDALFRRARDAAVTDCPSAATVRFHDSRSEAITRLSRKLGVLELARVVGHRDLRSLMSYYHSTAADLAKKLD